MNQMNKNGLWLRQMELRQEYELGWAVDMAFAMLSSMVFLIGMAKITGFDGIYSPWPMIVSSLVLCASFGFAYKNQKQKLLYPLVLLALLAASIFLGQYIIDGFCIAWNRMGDMYTASKGIVIPELSTPDESTSLGLLVFSVFAALITGLAFIALISIRKTIVAILVPLSIFGAMVLLGRECSITYIAILLLSSLALLLYGGSKKTQDQPEAYLRRLVPVMLISILIIVVTSIPVVMDWAADISEDTKANIHKNRYETEHTTLPEGDLAHFEDTKDKNHVALVVNMANPEPLYLRGFIGDIYQDGTWTALDNEIIANHEELLYWMNQNNYDPKVQYDKALTAIDGDHKAEYTNTVTVQNINGCSKYMYVPYNLCYGEYLIVEDISAGGVVSGGERTYMYDINPGGTKKISETIATLNDSNEGSALEYKKVENAYRKFVYENYLQIPKDIMAELGPEWEKHTSSYGKLEELSNYEKQECAMAFLERIEGDSFDYATVAALTLRYYGIPTRYVEGYTITQELIDQQENPNSISVDGNCGEAWVEVYQDGIGWLPQSITLGINEDENQIEEQEKEEKPIEKPEPSEAPDEETEETLEEPTPDGGYMVTITQSLPTKILMGVLVLALLALAIVLRRKWILDRRKKLLQNEENKDAVAMIFASTVKLLTRLGLERKNGSMMELIEPIKKRFEEEYASEYESMVNLNSKALFSSRQMNENERDTAERFYNKTLQILRDNSKWYKKLWMQWILCLY